MRTNMIWRCCSHLNKGQNCCPNSHQRRLLIYHRQIIFLHHIVHISLAMNVQLIAHRRRRGTHGCVSLSARIEVVDTETIVVLPTQSTSTKLSNADTRMTARKYIPRAGDGIIAQVALVLSYILMRASERCCPALVQWNHIFPPSN